MKSQSYSRFFQPIYVLVAGALGGGISASWFFRNFPLASDSVGQAFADQFEFWVWAFLILVTMCLAMVFLLPAWGIFFWLFDKQVLSLDRKSRILEISKLFLTAVLFLLIIFFVIQTSKGSNVGIQIKFPENHSERLNILFGVGLLVVLPITMGMSLTYKASQDLLSRIQAAGQAEGELFSLTAPLLTYRSILQNSLIMAAILLSMIPINSLALRTAVIAVYPEIEPNFPTASIIVYGLSFTLILLLIYLPAHFALSEASQKLRDSLSPLESMTGLKDTIEKRKHLDALLKTNMGLFDNLKSGIITFAPLISSILVSLGIQLN